MGLNRYEVMKEQVIDKMVEGAYKLAPIHNRLDLVVQDFPHWDMERKIEELEEDLAKELAKSETYKKLQKLKGILDIKKKEVDITKTLVRDYMLNNDIEKIEWMNKVLTVNNRQTVVAEVENINEIPEEFIRTTRELNKVEAKRYMKETGGVMIPGVRYVVNDNFSLSIKEAIK